MGKRLKFRLKIKSNLFDFFMDGVLIAVGTEFL